MMTLTIILVFIAVFAASASAQCTFPAMIQNSVYNSSSISTWTFQTSAYQYADTTGLQYNVTCDGMQGDYYFGRVVSSLAPTKESYGCLKYEMLATNVFRFLEYSNAEIMNMTLFNASMAPMATYMTACNTSSSYTISPEQRYTAVKQGSTVSGNSCPSSMRGVYNYTLDPSAVNNCAMTNDKFTSCGTENIFDTTNCVTAQTLFGRTTLNPLKKFQCMIEDAGMGEITFLTVVDTTAGVPGCVAYKKTGNTLMATYREGICNNNQTETWVDQNGRSQSMYMLEDCSSDAAAVLPGLLFLMSVLLFNLL